MMYKVETGIIENKVFTVDRTEVINEADTVALLDNILPGFAESVKKSPTIMQNWIGFSTIEQPSTIMSGLNGYRIYKNA